MKNFAPFNQILNLSLVVLLIATSCLNDIDDVISTEERPEPSLLENYEPIIRPVTGSVVLFVKDKNGDPVAEADVAMQGAFLGKTDTYGHFITDDITLNARGSMVLVSKDGFFDGSRRFFPIAGENSYVKIQLIDKNFNYAFDAQSGGTINLPQGASINFQSGTISKSNGEIYNGNVNVAAEWLDPSAAETLDRMPGNLQGVNELNQEVALATFGMMAVELMGSGGETLNIAEGSTAILTMPVPVSLQANAPAEIPLWSFYEPLGIWVVEGSATLSGGMYSGAVSHFSFWNCDAPFPLIEFEAQFIDEFGDPIVSHQVNILFSGSYTGSAYTDFNGFVSGLIPANEELVLQVLNICNEVIFTLPIGPFSTDISLGQITVPAGTGVNNTTITGELLNCDALPVTEGLVIAEFNGQTAYLYTYGSPFEFTLTSCSGFNEVVVTGVDLAALLQSDPLVVNPNTTTDLGQINVCDEQLLSYLVLTVDGVTKTYPDVYATVDSGFTSIQLPQQPVNDPFIYFGFSGDEIGDYSNANFVEAIFDQQNMWWFTGGSFSTFDVTGFGGIGEYIVGSFDGTLTGQGGTSVVSGSFNIVR